MSSGVKWWSRLAAATTGAVLTLVVPVHAWAASNGGADVAVEAVKYRRRSFGSGLGLIGAICCLAVVAVIVLVIVLISRNRKRR